MIQDMGLTMADKQAVTVTADSTYAIDAVAAGDPAKPLWWIVKVDTLFVTADAATLAVSLQTAAAASFAELPGMAVAATAVANLTAGAILAKRQLPYGLLKNTKTVFTVGTGSFSAGKVSSFITDQPDNF